MKLFRWFVFFYISLLTCVASAQPYFIRNDSIPVKINGSYITNPWAGGINFIQASEIDLNQDGIKDLFIFDRTGNKIRTFINNGTANNVDYRYAPQYESKFPNLHDWALLRDYNCDGKEDIFSYSGGGFAVYKNTSSIANGLQFTLVTPLQYSMYYPPSVTTIYNLYISSVDIPAITDIDGDGDLDIITFGILGTYLEYHQNQSMELYGSCDSLKFQIKNNCWGFAAESPYTNIFTLHDTCSGNIANPGLAIDTIAAGGVRSADRHSGSCELCLDLNGDGDKDLVVGGVSYNNLTAVTNGGSPLLANMTAVDPAFPSHDSSTTAVNMTLFPCAYYLDVNNDGKKDLLVSPNAPNVSENFNSLIYYKNIGTSSYPVFQFQQSNLLQDNMIEVGEGAYPVLFDYDNDGLKDLFVGNYGYFNTPNYTHQIAQFRNTGTASNPQFELITRDYANLSSLGIANMMPAFGDLDGDGDADMIIGGLDGKLQYFENNAPIGSPANFVLSQANFKNSFNHPIDIGDCAAPQIVDVDNDGKNDLVIGGRNGKITYYHHTGIGTEHVPVMDSVTNYWGDVKVTQYGYTTGYSTPFVFKQSGVTKLLAGSEEGHLRLYGNIDGNLNGSFTMLDSVYLNIYEGTRTALTGADITNDGYMDLIIGNYAGGVSYYKGCSTILSINNIDNSVHWHFDLFPNPADNTVNVKIQMDNNNAYTLDLYTIMGQLVMSQKIINNTAVLRTGNLSQGIYICKVSEINNSGNKINSLVKRIVIQH